MTIETTGTQQRKGAIMERNKGGMLGFGFLGSGNGIFGLGLLPNLRGKQQ